jgi:NAD(P)-dependent dehydrogenase (short-subunit alcohol dehydrogenase family)
MPPERPWAVVIGVSSGVGAAVARAVTVERGFDLFGMHRGHHQEAADALRRDVVASGARAEIVCGDAATLERAAEETARLRVVAGPRSVRLFVHSLADASLGSFVHGPGDPFHPRQFEKTFQTMAHSFVYWAQQLVARELLAPGACLLALTNPFGDQLCGGFGMVTAAKAALEVYVRHLAFELGPLGYRVNAVKFGLVETVAVRRAFSDEAWERVVGRVSAATPYGRIATVDEVGRFLASLTHEETRWLNGATIDLTGGQVQSLLHYLFHHR